MQNGVVKSCKCRMQDELLNKAMFCNMAHARITISDWTADDNIERPHSALGYTTLTKCARTLTAAVAQPLAARNESSARRTMAQPASIGVNSNLAPVAVG